VDPVRSGKRAPHQLRPHKISIDTLDFADGSAFIEVGRTRVLAAATIDERVPPFLRGTGQGWVTAEYAMLPRATTERTPRERVAGRISGRTQEIQRLVGRALRAVTDLRALGERQIIIDCDVIQADGGTRAASVTAGCVALGLALKKMIDQGLIDIRCFNIDPSIKSSLKFLRRTPWARKKVEELYLSEGRWSPE
jgi:ribonuclease PH